MTGNTARKLRMNYESVTMYESCTNKKKFVTKLGIKAIYACLGITFKINVHRRAAVILTLHLECQYQLLIIRKRLLRKER